MAKGFNDINTDSSDYNLLNFLINSSLAKVSTSFLVEVIGVYPESNNVDVLPLVQGMDAMGNELEQSPIYRIPYFSYRGGINEMKLTPAIGDYGVCITSYRDIADVKKTGKRAKPATLRMFDPRDSLYLGCFLSKENSKNYINIADHGITAKSIGSTTIETIGETEIISESNILIKSEGEKNKDTPKITIGDNRIKLNVGDSNEIILSKEGLEINVSEITIKTPKLNIDGVIDGTIRIENLTSTITNLTSNITNLKYVGGKIDLKTELGFGITGSTVIIGAINTTSINGKPPQATGEGEPTAGVLTTSILPNFEDLSYLIPPTKPLKFKISIGQDESGEVVNELTIEIEREVFDTYKTYDDLVAGIESKSEDIFTLKLIEDPFFKDKYQMTFTTVGVGKNDGYISYLENITENVDGKPGILSTGKFPGLYQDFVQSLNSQGLAFRINAGGVSTRYQVLYQEISTKTSFTELADYMTNLNPKLTVKFNATAEKEEDKNRFQFITNDVGALKGSVSYMKSTDTAATPAILNSGKLFSWEEFKQFMGSKDFAVKNKINDSERLYFLENETLSRFNSYDEFIKEVFYVSNLSPSVSYIGIITLSTISTGVGSTLTYFEPVDHIDATSATLTTGILPKIEDVKKAFGQGTMKVTFYIQLARKGQSAKRIDFVMKPGDIESANSWYDIADFLNNFEANDILDIVCYKNTRSRPRIRFGSSFIKGANIEEYYFKFIDKKTGKAEISYLKYDPNYNPDPEPEPAVQTVDGASILMGIESVATIVDGLDENKNINENSNTLLKLTEAEGAHITQGADDVFNSNSIYLLKGTQDTDAELQQGKDGKIVMLNDSADVLKGTLMTGATRMSGTDDGGIDPSVFDGIAKFYGNMIVSEGIEAEKIKINEETDITGKITLNPEEKIEEEVVKKSDVLVNGGIISEKLTVTEEANIEKLQVNNGVEITGDINIDSGKIKSNGNTLSFTSEGIKNSKKVIGIDFEAEGFI